MRKTFAFCLLLLSSAAMAEVTADNPWIAEGPPGAAVLAGFMELHNDGEREVALVAASSADFERVELHRTVHEGGMAKMVAQPAIAVPAKGSVTLQPGGLHLMLIEPKRNLVEGDSSILTLRFDDGGSMQLQVPVRKMAAGQQHDHHGHHQH